jgi:hypothetical protein
MSFGYCPKNSFTLWLRPRLRRLTFASLTLATLNKSIAVIASAARQSSIHAKSTTSGSPRRFAPRDDGFNRHVSLRSKIEEYY